MRTIELYYHWRALRRCAAIMQADPSSHSLSGRDAKYEEAAEAGCSFLGSIHSSIGWSDPNSGRKYYRLSKLSELQPRDLEAMAW